jgi:hypothetical protein
MLLSELCNRFVKNAAISGHRQILSVEKNNICGVIRPHLKRIKGVETDYF